MASSLPKTVRAWTYTTRGSPSNLLLQSKPAPTLLPTPSVVVRVSHAALNPGAVFLMHLIPAFLRFPDMTPDFELSGTVVESSGESLKAGDRVVGYVPSGYALKTGTGALQEAVALPEECAVKLQGSEGEQNMEDAAGVTMAGLCAVDLCEKAGLKRGDRVLVNAASGGIGSMTVQVARNIVGPEGVVVGVTSTRNVDMVKSLGCDVVIDYTAHQPLSTHLKALFGDRPLDAILDCIGVQDIYAHSRHYLKEGAKYAALGIRPPDFGIWSFTKTVWQMRMNEWWPVSRLLGGVGRPWCAVAMMAPTHAMRERVVRMWENGEIKVLKQEVLKFEDAKKGYEVVASGRTRGKIIVKVEE